MENANKGYTGWAMSNRAVAAYENGEQPASKWTKKAMLAAIACELEDTDRVAVVDFAKMKKADLFKNFFQFASWHHTSKFFNATDFYALNASEIWDASREMTPEELKAREEAKAEARKAEEAREEARKAEEAKAAAIEAAVIKATGYELGRVGAYVVSNPAAVIEQHTGKRGGLVVTYEINGTTRTNSPSARDYDTVDAVIAKIAA